MNRRWRVTGALPATGRHEARALRRGRQGENGGTRARGDDFVLAGVAGRAGSRLMWTRRRVTLPRSVDTGVVPPRRLARRRASNMQVSGRQRVRLLGGWGRLRSAPSPDATTSSRRGCHGKSARHCESVIRQGAPAPQSRSRKAPARRGFREAPRVRLAADHAGAKILMPGRRAPNRSSRRTAMAAHGWRRRSRGVHMRGVGAAPLRPQGLAHRCRRR